MVKRGLIVLGVSATLLAGVLAPITGFAAEKSDTQPNVKVNASYDYVPSSIFVGSSFSFPGKYKYPYVWFGEDVVSVDVFGKVTGALV